MQSMISHAIGRGALLFVRSSDDVAASMRMANELLRRRRHGDAAEAFVLGIVVGTRLDGSLHEPVDDDVDLVEAWGVCGVWSLMWVDAGSARGPRAVRERLLELVVQGAAPRRQATRLALVPVATRWEEADVGGLFAAIEERFPSLELVRTLVVDDPRRGGLVQGSAGATIARASLRG